MSLIRTGYPMYCAHFPGGDPRRFEPDPDGATLEEMERWKAACAAADAQPGLDRLDGAGVWEVGPGYAALLHLTMFGPGTYYYESDPFEDEKPWEDDITL